MTRWGPMLALAATVVLGGCNQTSAPQPVPVQPSGVGVSPVTPSSFRLPGGEGCAGELARFRAVMDNDLSTGHTTASVHKRVTDEISGHDARCSAGDQAGALAGLRGTKTRFGYP